VLFYSWVDVLGWDRLVAEADPRVAAWQRRQARAVFRLAEDEGCRHAALVGHFGEALAPCGSACDRCTGEELALGPAPRGATARARRGPRRRRRAT
jgi:ATP-dependent DNA helicase RecQ